MTTKLLNSLRDAIRGYVKFDSLEWSILNSRPVQRTRFLRRLGWTYLVFPGAEHSRLSHAIGSMALAGRVCDSIHERTVSIDTNGNVKRISRLFALLHAIGAAPFEENINLLRGAQLLESELLISIFTQHNDDTLRQKLLLALKGLSLDNELHLSRQVALSSLLMDGLVRDSRFCGVSYGNFDLDRLVDCLTVTAAAGRQPMLSVDMPGLPALEGAALAAHSMSSQVYRHPLVAAARAHFEEWARHEHLFERENDFGKFLRYDDLKVVTLLRESKNSHAEALLTRQFYPMIGEFMDDPLLANEKSAAVAESYLTLYLTPSPSVSEFFHVREDGNIVKPEAASRFIRSIEVERKAQARYFVFGARPNAS